jgi:hypothetical protein
MGFLAQLSEANDDLHFYESRIDFSPIVFHHSRNHHSSWLAGFTRNGEIC